MCIVSGGLIEEDQIVYNHEGVNFNMVRYTIRDNDGNFLYETYDLNRAEFVNDYLVFRRKPMNKLPISPFDNVVSYLRFHDLIDN